MTLVMSPSRFKWCPPHSCHCILRRREKWRDKWFLFGWWEVDYECGVNYYRENTVISPPVIFFCGCGGCVFKRCVAYTMEGDWLHFSKSRVQAAAVIGTVLCVFFPPHYFHSSEHLIYAPAPSHGGWFRKAGMKPPLVTHRERLPGEVSIAPLMELFVFSVKPGVSPFPSIHLWILL